MQYDELSNGPHHFEVRAIDDQGFVDPTPATVDWTVDVTVLKSTIDQYPTDPTSRAASFSFSGISGVVAFECALDSVVYNECSSPQSYTGSGDGLHTFLVRGLDGAGNKGAAARFTWTVENALPVADDQLVTTFQDTPVDIILTASDSDALIYHLVNLPTHGVVLFTAPNMVRYAPDSGYAGIDSFTFVARDAVGESNLATVTVVTNFEPVIAVDQAPQLVQYSDGLPPVTVTVSDEDSPGASLTILPTTWSSDGVNYKAGLPPQLSLNQVSNNGGALPGEAIWELSGVVELPVGVYTVKLAADDGVGGTITGDPVTIIIQVTPEDVMLRFHGGNPRAVKVQTAGDDNSGPFDLSVDVKERYPDNGVSALSGDIAQAVVSMQLVPIGPGSTVDPAAACSTELHDIDYDARLTVTCHFDSTPINTYVVAVTVDGLYYSGYGEDVVTVYDPSLGFTTGGGRFIWPGTVDAANNYDGDDTTFGFSIEYNKKGKNVKGRLFVTRHLADGSLYRIKSNSLDGLALGEDQANGFTWANFSGKATYQSPKMDVAEGNHTFIAYVEDHGDSGDRFWLQVKDKDGNVIQDTLLG